MNTAGKGYRPGAVRDALQLLLMHMICNFHTFPSVGTGGTVVVRKHW